MTPSPDLEPEPQSLTLRLWAALARAYGAVQAEAADEVARHGLTLAEFGVLEALLHRGPMQLGEVQRRILVSSGGITYLVDRLEKRALVERRGHPLDRRARLVALTADGETLVNRIVPEHTARIKVALAGLGKKEKREALRLLRALVDAPSPRPPPPPAGAQGGGGGELRPGRGRGAIHRAHPPRRSVLRRTHRTGRGRPTCLPTFAITPTPAPTHPTRRARPTWLPVPAPAPPSAPPRSPMQPPPPPGSFGGGGCVAERRWGRGPPYRTITRSVPPRPNVSGEYISSARGGGTMKSPGVVARATYV